MIRSGHFDRPDHRVDALCQRNQVTVQLGDILLSTGKREIPVDMQAHAVAEPLAFDQKRVEPRAGNVS
jgi:hypothetical protein